MSGIGNPCLKARWNSSDCLERNQEVIVFGGLVEKAISANKRALPLIFRICVIGQNVDFRRRARKLLAELSHDLDSAAFLQTNVGDNDIRLRLHDRVNRLLFALRKTDDVKITQRLDVVDNAFSNQRRILDDKNAHSSSHGRGSTLLRRQFIKLWRSAYAVRSALREKSIFSKMRLL